MTQPTGSGYRPIWWIVVVTMLLAMSAAELVRDARPPLRWLPILLLMVGILTERFLALRRRRKDWRGQGW